jgi:hypothetical protein
VILLDGSGGGGSLRSEEGDEQDFGIALDRVPNVGLHVGGHCCENLTNQKETSGDSVVVRRVLSVYRVDVLTRSSERDDESLKNHFSRTSHVYIHDALPKHNQAKVLLAQHLDTWTNVDPHGEKVRSVGEERMRSQLVSQNVGYDPPMQHGRHGRHRGDSWSDATKT